MLVEDVDTEGPRSGTLSAKLVEVRLVASASQGRIERKREEGLTRQADGAFGVVAGDNGHPTAEVSWARPAGKWRGSMSGAGVLAVCSAPVTLHRPLRSVHSNEPLSWGTSSLVFKRPRSRPVEVRPHGGHRRRQRRVDI